MPGVLETWERPAAEPKAQPGAAASRVRAAPARRRRKTRPRAAWRRTEASIEEIALTQGETYSAMPSDFGRARPASAAALPSRRSTIFAAAVRLQEEMADTA